MKWITVLMLAVSGCYHSRAPAPPAPSRASVEAPVAKVLLAVESGFGYFGIPVQEVGKDKIRSGSFLVKGHWALDPAGERIRCYSGGRPLRIRPGDNLRLSAVVQVEEVADSLTVISVSLKGSILPVAMLGTTVGGARCTGAQGFAERLAHEMKKRGEVYVVRKGQLVPRNHEHRAVAVGPVHP